MLVQALWPLALAAPLAGAVRPGGPWRALSSAARPHHPDREGSGLSAADAPKFKAYNLSVPVDHFHGEARYEPHSHESFNLRYWLDSSSYKEGGPVIVLHSGEAPGEERLPYLEYGIASILSKATHGIAVVLEHRYYGTSVPVPDLTAHSLRFLSTEQALADNAYFARHVRFAGLEHLNLTSEHVSYLIYGGSYAGAIASFTRVLYPDVYWGAISSSGVPVAIGDFWQYLEAARRFAPGDCSPTTQKLTHVVDSVLLGRDRARADEIKDLFGLGELHDDEFGTTIAGGIMSLQSADWDPAEDSADFGTYCAIVTSDVPLFASTAHLRPAVRQAVAGAGYDADLESLAVRMLNYIGYVRDQLRRDQRGRCKSKSLRECYSMRFSENDESLQGGWLRSWFYQTCTEWGYLITGSGVPQDSLALVSRAVTLEYASEYCPRWFNITKRPDVNVINKLGGYNLSYPRLAFIDGAQDPWRQASPHAIGLAGRPSSTSEPLILIDPGVHHWDERGVRSESDARAGLPPKQVSEVQNQEVDFVKAWVQEWHDKKNRRLQGTAAGHEL